MLNWLRAYLNLTVLAAGGALAIILGVAFISLLWFVRQPVVMAGPGTAVMNVIPAPSDTPVLPTAAPTETPPPPPDAVHSGGPISVGAYVQITGTGSAGVRMRSAPGLNTPVLFLAIESEVFRVQEGPQSVDGYTWWYLVAPYNEDQRGWTAADYLNVIQNP